MTFEPYLTPFVDLSAFPDVKPATLDAYESRPDPHTGYAGARKAIETFPQNDHGCAPELIQYVKDANLRGRGGAGFNAGLKWSFVPEQYDGPKYLVCNADESEPGTVKDIVLLRGEPHMILEGMIIACWAVGVQQAYIYMRGEFSHAYDRVVAAINEAKAKGYLGQGIFGTRFDLDIYVVRGSGAYICGEETGMLSSLEGIRPYPKVKPPFPANPGGGYCGHPTVVNNVETIANLPHILRRGADWFQSIGPESGHGAKLICISGHATHRGLHEVPLGIPLSTLLTDDAYAGGVWQGKKLKAVIPGGVSAHVLTADEALEVDYDFASLQGAGTMLGSGGIVMMDEDTCMVDALYNLVRFYHHESCGQCTPCREGTDWLDKILKRIVSGRGRPEDVDLMREICNNGVGRTVCVLIDACAFPVLSYTEKFRHEFDYHCKHGRSLTYSRLDQRGNTRVVVPG